MRTMMRVMLSRGRSRGRSRGSSRHSAVASHSRVCSVRSSCASSDARATQCPSYADSDSRTLLRRRCGLPRGRWAPMYCGGAIRGRVRIRDRGAIRSWGITHHGALHSPSVLPSQPLHKQCVCGRRRSQQGYSVSSKTRSEPGGTIGGRRGTTARRPRGSTIRGLSRTCRRSEGGRGPRKTP